CLQQAQLVGQQLKDLGVRLGGLEQPAHRVAGPGRRVKRGGVLAQRPMGGDGADAGDRQQLAATFVQPRQHVEERLQPGAEPAARAPRALGERAQTTVIRGIEMKDAVSLAVADRPQHDRLGLQRAGHDPPRAILNEAMKQVTVYTTDFCPYCSSAKNLLAKRSIAYEEINLARDPDGRSKLAELTGMITFPQIVINGETLGGFQELLAADRAGTLSELL